MLSDAPPCISQTKRSCQNGTHYEEDEKKTTLQKPDRKQAEEKESWIGICRLRKKTSVRDAKELLSVFIR